MSKYKTKENLSLNDKKVFQNKVNFTLLLYFQNLLLNEKVYGRKTPTYLLERYNYKKLKIIKISDGIEPSTSLQNDITLTLRNEKMLF